MFCVHGDEQQMWSWELYGSLWWKLDWRFTAGVYYEYRFGIVWILKIYDLDWFFWGFRVWFQAVCIYFVHLSILFIDGVILIRLAQVSLQSVVWVSSLIGGGLEMTCKAISPNSLAQTLGVLPFINGPWKVWRSRSRCEWDFGLFIKPMKY